jgi:hypothetical protein
MFWKKQSEPKKITVIAARINGPGRFHTHVVGESSYQGALRKLAGGYQRDGVRVPVMAVLIPEPSNTFDPNAVMVHIDNRKVGYLSRDEALEFRECMAKLDPPRQVAAVDAIIVGGFVRADGEKGHFGVQLDLEFPFP